MTECVVSIKRARGSLKSLIIWVNIAPPWKPDVGSSAWKYKVWQLNGNKIHAPTVNLHILSTPCPFYTWAFNLISPINPLSRGHLQIRAGTKCYTKWVDAMSLKQWSSVVVANFISDNIIDVWHSQAFTLWQWRFFCNICINCLLLVQSIRWSQVLIIFNGMFKLRPQIKHWAHTQ